MCLEKIISTLTTALVEYRGEQLGSSQRVKNISRTIKRIKKKNALQNLENQVTGTLKDIVGHYMKETHKLISREQYRQRKIIESLGQYSVISASYI